MGKRVNVQRTEKERIEFLKKWREHPVWSLEEAARQLKVRPSTLLDWKNRYWSKLDSITGSDRICRKGAGPSRKMTPYEDKVLRYYHVCLRGKGVCRFSELLAYCRGLEEIVLDKPNTHTQETWVERFIAYYSSRATGNYFSRSRGDGDSAEISSGDGDILDECNDITGGGCTNSSGSDSISGGEMQALVMAVQTPVLVVHVQALVTEVQTVVFEVRAVVLAVQALVAVQALMLVGQAVVLVV
ncbi:hypothetical protein PC128_g18855 [Phytophthora cactorum]|nr:hypothetical protein PC128_g18855 [Phytophthora cactorum]